MPSIPLMKSTSLFILIFPGFLAFHIGRLRWFLLLLLIILSLVRRRWRLLTLCGLLPGCAPVFLRLLRCNDFRLFEVVADALTLLLGGCGGSALLGDHLTLVKAIPKVVQKLQTHNHMMSFRHTYGGIQTNQIWL